MLHTALCQTDRQIASREELDCKVCVIATHKDASWRIDSMYIRYKNQITKQKRQKLIKSEQN